MRGAPAESEEDPAFPTLSRHTGWYLAPPGSMAGGAKHGVLPWRKAASFKFYSVNRVPGEERD